jgi:hypothetical protein
VIRPFVNVLLARSDNLSTQYAALGCECEIEMKSSTSSIYIDPNCFILGTIFTLTKMYLPQWKCHNVTDVMLTLFAACKGRTTDKGERSVELGYNDMGL